MEKSIVVACVFIIIIIFVAIGIYFIYRKFKANKIQSGITNTNPPNQQSAGTSGQNQNPPNQQNADSSKPNQNLPNQQTADSSKPNQNLPNEQSAGSSGQNQNLPNEQSAGSSGQNQNPPNEQNSDSTGSAGSSGKAEPLTQLDSDTNHKNLLTEGRKNRYHGIPPSNPNSVHSSPAGYKRKPDNKVDGK